MSNMERHTAASSSSPATATTMAILSSASVMLLTYGAYQYFNYDKRWWWKKRSDQRGSEVCHAPNWETALIHGRVAPGWERVREEFVHNFRVRGELGAAVCVYHRGVKVVDLWGGYADRDARTPWEEDTMTPIFSSTKGLSAIALYMLVSRGELDLNERVVKYWPEFGAKGKEDVTVMDLIDHGVGLAGIDPPLTLEMLQREDSHEAIRDHIAAAEMEWPTPGDRKGYMAVMLGFYESALVQLTDGNGRRTIGKFLREEAFVPLSVQDEVYIGLPDSVPSSRVARIDGMSGMEPLWPNGGYPPGLMKRLLTQPNSYTGRAFRNPQLSSVPSVLDYNRREVQAIEMPASGGVATARAVATVYRAVERAVNGKDPEEDNPLGLSRKLLEELLSTPAKPGRIGGWMDEILGIEACLGAGMLLPPPPRLHGTPEAVVDNGGGRFASAPGRSSFGTGGAGGSFGFCDVDAEIAYSYVMNRCGQLIVDDPREYALRDKVYEAVRSIRRREEGGRAPENERMGTGDAQLNLPHYIAKKYMDDYPELAPLP